MKPDGDYKHHMRPLYHDFEFDCAFLLGPWSEWTGKRIHCSHCKDSREVTGSLDFFLYFFSLRAPGVSERGKINSAIACHSRIARSWPLVKFHLSLLDVQCAKFPSAVRGLWTKLYRDYTGHKWFLFCRFVFDCSDSARQAQVGFWENPLCSHIEYADDSIGTPGFHFLSLNSCPPGVSTGRKKNSVVQFLLEISP